MSGNGRTCKQGQRWRFAELMMANGFCIEVSKALGGESECHSTFVYMHPLLILYSMYQTRTQCKTDFWIKMM